MILTAEQKIEKAHVQIMGHEATRAYSALIMVGDSRVDDNVPTAYTNGRDKVYGRAFVDKLSAPEIVGLIIHEAGHVMYQHGYMWKHLWAENAALANQAADYVINLEIAALNKKYPHFIALPADGLLDHKFTGMDTQEVFNILKQDDDGKGGGGFDEHDFSDLSDDERKELQGEIESAIRQGAMLASKLGGDSPRGFKELTEPKVNWREQLQEWTSSICAGADDSTWRRPNRRWLQQDLYMPSTISETLSSIAIVIDTSGSVDAELVSTFMSEVVGVCDMVSPEIVHVICCDAKVQSHDVYDRDAQQQLAQVRSLKGGGGTDMCSALDYIEEQKIDPEVVLVLTDGYTPFPNALTRPTLWAITTPHISAPAGVTIHVKP
jgi:predicted metal-dependent peptidase